MAKKGERLSPETIEKMRAAKREHWQRPEYRDKMRVAVSASWDQPGRRERYRALRTRFRHTPETIEKMRQSHRRIERHADSAYRAALSRAALRLWESADYREKVLARVRDPEVKARANTPESRERKRAAKLQDWAALSPEARRQRTRRWTISGTAASVRRNSGTSIERLVEAVLIALGVEYRSQENLGRYHIDFLIPAQQLCIECDGDYWHSRPAQIAADAQRDSWLRHHGYRVVRLSESVIRADARAAVREALELASSE